MKNLLSVLLLSGLFMGQTKAQGTAMQAKAEQTTSTGFVVTGNIQGLADGDVKIITNRGEAVAEGKAKAGVFSLKGTVAEPGLYMLVLGKNENHYLFLENGPIKVSGTKADLKNIKIEGTAAQNDPAFFNRTFAPILSSLDALGAQIKALPEEKKQPLVNKYQNLLTQLQTEAQKSIAQRPSSHVSLLMLSVVMQLNQNVAEVEAQFNSLAEPLRNSSLGKEIASYLTYAKVGSVGSEALDFTQNDVNSNPVSLSSFRGKYVLVDFWASWCRPCRMENPNVVKVFNKFKDKNFTVLGVSLDQQKEAWVNAIEKDKLTWTHVSDLQFWNNAAAQLYRVQSIPQNFLIDPSGKIVAKDLRGQDLEKKLCEYLGCSN